jgi:hypothetical protein
MTFRSLGNPSFLVVTMFGVFAAMAGGLGNALGTYMGLYFWKFSPQQLSTLVRPPACRVYRAPLSPWLSSRFGKKRAGIWLAFIWVLPTRASGPEAVRVASADGSTALLALFFGSALISTTLFICAIV